MTEIIIYNIENIADLAMFSESYKKRSHKYRSLSDKYGMSYLLWDNGQ